MLKTECNHLAQFSKDVQPKAAEVPGLRHQRPAAHVRHLRLRRLLRVDELARHGALEADRPPDHRPHAAGRGSWVWCYEHKDYLKD